MAKLGTKIDVAIEVGLRFQADNAQGPKGWIRFVGPVEAEAPPAVTAAAVPSIPSPSNQAA